MRYFKVQKGSAKNYIEASGEGVDIA